MRKTRAIIKNDKYNQKKIESVNSFDLLDDSDDTEIQEKTTNHADKFKQEIHKGFVKNNLHGNRKNNDKLIDIVSNNNTDNNNNYEINDDNIENKEDKEKWESVEKKKNYKKKCTNRIPYNLDYDVEFEKDALILDNSDDGSEYKFSTKWYIWTHLSESTNWSPESYKHIFTIDSLKTFWEFIGNIDKLDIIKHQFYIMRESSHPTWEHNSNRQGGICSLRVVKDRSLEIIEQLSLLVMNESFSDDPLDINGLSFSAKHNWGVIKIWNKLCTNDVSTQVPIYMIRKYGSSPRYEKNEPEY